MRRPNKTDTRLAVELFLTAVERHDQVASAFAMLESVQQTLTQHLMAHYRREELISLARTSNVIGEVRDATG